jgi:hypothetical protein
LLLQELWLMVAQSLVGLAELAELAEMGRALGGTPGFMIVMGRSLVLVCIIPLLVFAAEVAMPGLAVMG